MVNRYLSQEMRQCNGTERQDRRLFKEVFVHLDLKGAPPTFPFLMDFVKYLGIHFEKVVTGIVFEFEDTFPYDGNLKPLKANNHYSKEQID